jgi:hypothetical protein
MGSKKVDSKCKQHGVPVVDGLTRLWRKSVCKANTVECSEVRSGQKRPLKASNPLPTITDGSSKSTSKAAEKKPKHGSDSATPPRAGVDIAAPLRVVKVNALWRLFKKCSDGSDGGTGTGLNGSTRPTGMVTTLQLMGVRGKAVVDLGAGDGRSSQTKLKLN